MIKLVNLFNQYQSTKKDIDVAISEVIKSGVFVSGKFCQKFEKVFAKYISRKYCLGVGNGTDALEIAIASLELPENGEIILPANTFIATAEAVVRAGFKPVFVEPDEENFTISISDLKRKLSSDTLAIIAVHLYGQPCQMDKIKKIAGKKIKIIEDCAQAHGAKYKTKMVGSIGDVGTFSFFPAKNLGAFGDGGAIVTNSKKIFLKCKLIANHGRIEKNSHKIIGRNSRLDSLQAAILAVKLKHLNYWNRQRRENAKLYFDNLSDVKDLLLPKIIPNTLPVFHQFVIRHKHRDQLKKYLEQRGIETAIHYPKPIISQLAFRKFSEKSKTPVAEKNSKEILSLPIAEHLSSKDICRVIKLIKEFGNKNG